MAMTDDRDVRDAICYATDAISNKLINDSMFIEKVKNSTENLKDCYYNIDWDRVRGLGEQNVEYMDEICELKLPKISSTAKIPTRDQIREKIILYNNFNRNVNMYSYIYEYACEDGCKIRSECYISVEDDINGVKRDRLLYMAKEELINKVLRHYRKKNEEEYGMTTMQFENLDTALRAMNGNLSIGFNGKCDIAHIYVPLNYLKYFDIKMPTTDFCVSKRKDTGNWIEGLPAIKKIETYNDRVTKVTFIDNTFTKSVCSENDHFDLDVGITICCMKRMMGKDGNKHYNDVIRHAHKVIVENDKKREKEAKEKAERKMKMRKEELKKAAGRLKTKEDQIDTQAQAIVKAHHMLEDERKNG